MIQPIGHFKLWRSLFTKPIWLNSTVEQQVILITLIAMANFKANEWEWKGDKYSLKPGQFVTSTKSIIANTGNNVSTQNVRTALKRFEKLEFLTNESTKEGRLITLVNWECYQYIDGEGNQAINQGVTKGSPRGNQELTPIEEGKKVEKVRKKEEYSLNSNEYRLAEYLYNHIKKNNPNHREVNLQSWAKDMDKVLRIDKRPVEEVKLVIEFTQKDSFWWDKVLSVRKLREKYDQLNIRRKKQSKPKPKQHKQNNRPSYESTSPHSIIGGGDFVIYDPTKERSN